MLKTKKLDETKRNMKMAWQFVKTKKSSLLFMILLSAILSAIGIITPILSAQLLLNLSGGLMNELLKVAIIMFLAEVCRNIVNFLFRKISSIYMIKTVTEIQIKMFEETLKIKTSEIDKNSSGTFIDRINNDTGDIINIFKTLSSSFIDFVSNVGILVAIFIINKYMFIYFILSSTIIWYFQKKRMDVWFNQNKNYRSVREKRTGLISEVVRGVRDVKLLNANEGILNKIKLQLKEVNKERLDMDKTDRKYTAYTANIRDFLDIVFIVLGIVLVNAKDLSLSNFMVLYMYKGRVESLLGFYNRLVEDVKSFNVSATRVFEILGDTFEKEIDDGIILDNIKGNIEFRNVTFAYDKEKVLKNVIFSISSGERVGFVGVSGSGKSTIFNLISRLYNLENGSILIDDVNINDISISSLREGLSLIPQNPYIFNFSIMDNIKITNNNATIEEVIEACEKADIMEKIEELPDKFNTKLGEGGVILSGGERQRLAIARSLLKKSNILLFDEATSALDNLTQYKVQNAIYGLDKNKTILIIAHRLSTVISCDKIIMIDDGKILDIGTHNELLKRCKKYKELFLYESKQNK